MSTNYEDSDFVRLFSGEGVGKRYNKAVKGENYVTPERLASRLAEQVKNLKLPDPKTVVALAVGTGLEASAIKKQFSNTHVIGVDLDDDMMKPGIKDGSIDQPVKANITEEIPEIESHKADTVVCCGGTEFNPGKLKDIANEMMRIVKPEGLLSITFRPPGQEAARPGYAYYSQDEVREVFSGATFLDGDEHVSFSMNQQSEQSSHNDGKKVDVIYNTLYFQAPSDLS